MSVEVTVTGGVGGVDAKFDDMHAAAAVLAGEADAVDALGRSALRLLDDGDLLASAVLCPGGAVAAQGQLMAAVCGPDGLVAVVVDVRMTSLRLEAAADLYVARERFVADLIVTGRYATGLCIAGVIHPLVEDLGGVSAIILAIKKAASPDTEAGVSAAEAETGHDGLGALPELLLELAEDNPFLVDQIAGMLPGVISGLFFLDPDAARAYTRETGRSPYPRTITDAAAMITPFLAVGRGRAVPVPAGAVSGSATAEWAPARLAEVIDGVRRRSEESATAAIPALIGVREIPAVRGRPRAWIVELPGTQKWNLKSGPNPMDLTTNVQTIAGGTTGYQQAVSSALRGRIPPGDPVMIVGHSQGGLTAAALAADPEVREEFNITHVVTAGSPIAGIAVPTDVQVLSMENSRDAIPHVEATENSPTAAHTTVVFDASPTGSQDPHSLAAYQAGARAVDDAPDPSLQAFRDGADVFLRADTPAVLHRFRLVRDPE